jgi:hypothetical protein
MLYGPGSVPVPDPMLSFSSSTHGRIVPRAVPVPQGAAPAPSSPPVATGTEAHSTVAAAPGMPAGMTLAHVRTVPMDPPPGAYGRTARPAGSHSQLGPAAAPPPSAPAVASDPFLQRAERNGADVSFG